MTGVVLHPAPLNGDDSRVLAFRFVDRDGPVVSLPTKERTGWVRTAGFVSVGGGIGVPEEWPVAPPPPSPSAL